MKSTLLTEYSCWVHVTKSQCKACAKSREVPGAVNAYRSYPRLKDPSRPLSSRTDILERSPEEAVRIARVERDGTDIGLVRSAGSDILCECTAATQRGRHECK